MTGYLHLRDDDQLLHHIARQLIRDRSQGLCDGNYPQPCSTCDCFDGASIRYAQQHASEVIKVLRGLSVEPTEDGVRLDSFVAEWLALPHVDAALMITDGQVSVRPRRYDLRVMPGEAVQFGDRHAAVPAAAPVPVQEDRP